MGTVVAGVIGGPVMDRLGFKRTSVLFLCAVSYPGCCPDDLASAPESVLSHAG